MRINNHEQKLRHRIIDLLRNDPGVVTSMQFSRDDSHSVILMQPLIQPGTSRFKYISDTYKMKPASRMLGVKLGYMSSKNIEYKGKELYQWLQTRSTTATAAGWFFDGRCQGVFSAAVGGQFSCTLMTDQAAIDELYKNYRQNRSQAPSAKATNSRERAHKEAKDTKKIELNFKECPQDETDEFENLSALSQKLRPSPGSRSFKRTLSGVHLRPSVPNLASVDSLMIDVDIHDQPRAFFFQFTISKTHPMAFGGLAAIWSALPDEVRQVPPAIILVIPEAIESGYKAQTIKDIDPVIMAEDNIGLWPQYRLGMKDARLWQLTVDYQILDTRRVLSDSYVVVKK